MQPNWLMQRSYSTPNRIGLTYGEQQWTFQQLFDRAETIACQLRARSLQAGERIAILAASTPDLIHVIYGCMHAQLEIVFLNNRLSKEELAYQLKDAAVKAVLVDAQYNGRVQYSPCYTFEQLFATTATCATFAAEWDEGQTISIMYTSGTTGFPKGVRQTLRNHEASAVNSALNLGIADHDVWLCAVPIFHISGFSMLMKSLLYGVEIKLYEKFDLVPIVDDLVSGRVTHMSVVAMTLGRIITEMQARGVTAHERFKLMLAGGGPIPNDFLQRAFKLNMNVAQTYGMTETASQTATLSSEEALRKLGSAGKPLFFNQIRIAGTNKPHVEGEILIRGPHVTPGYIGQFATREAQVDGWLYSGDIGYLDEEGFLFVVDRRADLIISGGENIYPAQIENVLLAHPAIKEAGVCGVEDATWGHVPAAFVVTAHKLTEEDVIAHCNAHLASYKVPKYVHFVDALPRNGANKLMRRKLKALVDK